MSEHEEVEIPEHLRRDTAKGKADFIRDGLLTHLSRTKSEMTFEESGEVLGGIINYAVGPMSVLLKARSQDLVNDAESLQTCLERRFKNG